MNQANLKQVLHVVVGNIRTKACVEEQAIHAKYKATQERIGTERDKRIKGVAKALATSPIGKVLQVKWKDAFASGESANFHYAYNCEYTVEAQAMIEAAQNHGAQELEAVNKLCHSSLIRFTYGPGPNDCMRVEVPTARLPVYEKLRDDFDALRVGLLLSDNDGCAVTVKKFLAALAKL